MSSNLRIKKICEQCKNVFVAKATVTQCCSDECAKKLYKARQRGNKIEAAKEYTKEKLRTASSVSSPTTAVTKELIDIKILSAVTGIGRTTLFKILRDESFPKLRVGRKLLFDKSRVFEYLNNKYEQI
jgi:predicted DNA-binding transcriptional regulator AlpA